jgi:hypothetical protein
MDPIALIVKCMRMNWIYPKIMISKKIKEVKNEKEFEKKDS